MLKADEVASVHSRLNLKTGRSMLVLHSLLREAWVFREQQVSEQHNLTLKKKAVC